MMNMQMNYKDSMEKKEITVTQQAPGVLDNENLLEALYEVASKMEKQQPRNLVIRTGAKGAQRFNRAIEDVFLKQRITELEKSGKFDSETVKGLYELMASEYEPDREVVRSIIGANEPSEKYTWHVAGMNVEVQENPLLEDDKYIIREKNEFDI